MSVVDFAKFLLESGVYSHKLLAGCHLHEVAEWKSKLKAFWYEFGRLDPDHEIFERHSQHLDSCVPILLHGDEGTSFGKKGLFEYSWTPLLSAGDSGLSRYFMISQIPHKFYGKLSKGNETGNPTLDAVMKAGVDSILLGFVNGIQYGGHTIYLIPVGLTGDHVFHAPLSCASGNLKRIKWLVDYTYVCIYNCTFSWARVQLDLYRWYPTYLSVYVIPVTLYRNTLKMTTEEPVGVYINMVWGVCRGFSEGIVCLGVQQYVYTICDGLCR